jgi:hypothetical protein
VHCVVRRAQIESMSDPSPCPCPLCVVFERVCVLASARKPRLARLLFKRWHEAYCWSDSHLQDTVLGDLGFLDQPLDLRQEVRSL